MQIIKQRDQQERSADGGNGKNESGSSAFEPSEPLSSEKEPAPVEQQTDGRTTSNHLDGNSRRTGPHDLVILEEDET